jgi:hypothetical protein
MALHPADRCATTLLIVLLPVGIGAILVGALFAVVAVVASVEWWRG